MVLTHDSARRLLRGHGQEHLLAFWARLDERQKSGLLEQIQTLDFDAIRAMRQMLGARRVGVHHAAIEPAPVCSLSPEERREARVAGEAAVRAGQVGVLLVAGGQGTRLGFDGPKGAFPIAPITNAPLFAIHARKILALENKYGAPVPFYIMTSRENDGSTRAFFRQHANFGLAGERVLFFTQGMWPALDEQGRIILDAPGHIFMSPDGHGGILTALRDKGMIEDMTRRGLTTLFYFQVDNPLVEVAEPAFIGAHLQRQADVSLKVCAKRDAEEGLGVPVVAGDRTIIVEYTELTRDQKHAKGPDGRLTFLFGSVAIHAFSLAFLRQEAARALPLHLAHKKVPQCDAQGAAVNPAAPNAFKFEKFIFDVLPHAGRALCMAFAREDEFSPVKNASGADSPEIARQDMMLKFARWLEACGIDVPRDAQKLPAHGIEIDPCYALGPEELKAKLPAGFRITGDTLLA